MYYNACKNYILSLCFALVLCLWSTKASAFSCYADFGVDFEPEQATLSKDSEPLFLDMFRRFNHKGNEPSTWMIEVDADLMYEPSTIPASAGLVRERIAYLKNLFVQMGVNPKRIYSRHDMAEDALFGNAIDMRVTPGDCGELGMQLLMDERKGE